MEALAQDVLYALRGMRKSPGFALVTILVVGLGVGITTVAFTWIERFVLSPLPAVPASDELLSLNTGGPGGEEWALSYPDLRDWREGVRSFEGITGEIIDGLSLRTAGPAEVAWGVYAPANYFDLLRVRPVLGRTFRPEDEGQAAPVAVISHALWQRTFAGDSGVLGRHVMLNGHDVTIVGVAPPKFVGMMVGLSLDLWLPVTLLEILTPERGTLASRDQRPLSGIARLRPGVTIAQARQEINALNRRLAELHPEDRNTTVIVRWFRETGAIGLLTPVLGALLGVAVLVLVVACANLANLLLARAAARRREIGIRLAVGAGRARLVRQLMTEILLLALGGGALGVLFALWGRDGIRAFIPSAPIPIEFDLPLDAQVFGFALVATVVTGCVLGVIPALQASRLDLVPALRDGAATGPAHRRRMQSGLVASQVALSLVCLVCAGLFVRGVQKAQSVDIGLGDPGRVLLVSTNLYLGGYASDSAGLPVMERLLAEVRALPGVRSAAVATLVPLGIVGRRPRPMHIEGYEPRPDEKPAILWNAVSSGYYETVRTPVLRGRGFAAEDRPGSLPVAVVNETFARRFWPGRDPLGRRLRFSDGSWHSVVGVVGDGKYRSLDEPALPLAYFPIQQRYSESFTLHVRADGDPRRLQQALRRAFQAVSPDLPFTNVTTLAEHVRAATFVQRMGAWSLAVLGGLALALSAVGLYGVLSYSVAQRTREMGVRIAIGASGRDVLGLVVGGAMRLTAIGLGIGIVLAAGAGQLLRSQIFGVSPLDPVTFAGIAALLLGVGLLAAWLPARRAARVDPIVALQAE